MSLIEQAGRTNGHAQTLSWSEATANSWSDAAPNRLPKRYPHRSAADGWQAWQAWLVDRRRPRPLALRAGGKHSPLTWALPGDLFDSALMEILEPLWRLERGKPLADTGRSKSKSATRKAPRDATSPADPSPTETSPDETTSDAASHLAQRLKEWTHGEPAPITLAYAVETLAWARALPALAVTLDEATWWGLWDQLVELSSPDLAGKDIVAPPHEHLLASQLLSAELPLTLAYLFPELSNSAPLGLAGWQSAKRAMEEHVLGEGFLSARLWDAYRPLFACWTRTWTIVEALSKRAAKKPKSKGKLAKAAAESPGEAPADSDAQLAPCPTKPFARPKQYERLLTTTLRLSRPDGSQMLSNEEAGRWSRPLFAAARRLTERSPAAKAMQVARPDKRSKKKSSFAKALCESAAHAEAAHAAILRPNWRRSAPRLAVAFNDGVTRLELVAAGQTLLSGEWSLDLMAGSEPAMLNARWEEICWISDSDVDYLEIEAKFPGGVRVQRQLLLARQDRFMLLADGVLGSGITASEEGLASSTLPAPLEYSASLRLAPGVSFEPARETFEGTLLSEKARVRVLPLALPEWRSAFSVGGEFVESDGRLHLRQQAHGHGLFAPLFFDLDASRASQPITWRRLTVAEELKALRDDVAVGYRVQVGKRQWLVYRSLVARASRSVLGQHLASEFMTGRFHRSGEVDRLVEVETE